MKKSKTLSMVVVLLILVVFGAWADGFVQSPLFSDTQSYSYCYQLGMDGSSPSMPSNAVSIAVANGSSYPVTPGDSFALTYVDGNRNVSMSFQVDNEYKMVIPSLTAIDARGMTLNDLKEYVEGLVSTYYPFSTPKLRLTSCGMFQIRVVGEVPYSRLVQTWGMATLSDFASLAGQYASTRKVEVSFVDGTVKEFDLYKATRENSKEDDVLVSPGCSIRFLKASTTVTVKGAVSRPGAYQPLEGETLGGIVERYCNGLLLDVDFSSVSVSRNENGTYVSTLLDAQNWKSYVPCDGDYVNFGSYNNAKSYVTIIGAVSGGSMYGSSSNKIMYYFVEGETAEQMLRNTSGLVSSSCDIDGIYLIRGGEEIPVDGTLAFATVDKGSTVLQQGDVVVLPFSKLFVTVNGAVQNPGNYAYVPGESAEYYISLARGLSLNARADGKFDVFDETGKSVRRSAPIGGGYTITAAKDTLGRDLAVASSVIVLTASVLMIISGISNLAK